MNLSLNGNSLSIADLYSTATNFKSKIALSPVAKKTMKVLRMDERTRNSLLKSKGDKFIIKNFKSKSFKDIERKWKVFIPFNKQDLEAYKEW